MEVRVSTLRKLFTLTGLLFYCGFIGFFFRVVSGGGGENQAADVEGNIVNQLIGLVILFVCLFLGFRKKLLLSSAFWRMHWPVGLFVGIVLGSFLWSIEPSITIRRGIALLTVTSFTLYLAQLYTTEQLFRFLGLLFGLAAFLGLIWAVVSPGRAFIAGGIREGAFLGIFSDKNGGARAYVLAILMLLPFSLKRDRLALAASFFCIVAILLAQSASAVMLLIIGGSTALYLNKLSGRSNLQLNTSMVVMGLMVYAFVAVCTVLGYQFVLAMLGRDATLTDRTLIWELIIPLMQQKFTLGYGFGAFWAGWGAEDFIERWGYTGNAHNGYLEIMLHGGVVLFAAFCLLVVWMTLYLLKSLIRSPTPLFSAISIAMILEMLVANYIAYALPNYRAFDYLIFMVVAFLALNERMTKVDGSAEA